MSEKVLDCLYCNKYFPVEEMFSVDACCIEHHMKLDERLKFRENFKDVEKLKTKVNEYFREEQRSLLKFVFNEIIFEITRLQSALTAERESHRWRKYPDEEPEDDGSLNIEDCCFGRIGNEKVVKTCAFYCKFTFDGREMKDDLMYNFETGSWECWVEGQLLDITVTHWQPLPSAPEAL